MKKEPDRRKEVKGEPRGRTGKKKGCNTEDESEWVLQGEDGKEMEEREGNLERNDVKNVKFEDSEEKCDERQGRNFAGRKRKRREETS